MNSRVYVIKCLTNMHVGSGSTVAGIVDNEVQRDTLTKYPTIHASSLKGAFREHIEIKNKDNEEEQKKIKELFGDEKKGKLKILPAYLSCIPVRSYDRPYILATSEDIMKEFSRQMDILKIPIKELEKASKKDVIRLEDIDEECNIFSLKYEILFGKECTILKDTKHVFETLPIIARNKLNSGVSENVWYEEIVPRESRFWFSVIGEKEDLDIFNDWISEDVIQIGANATVGYGYTKIEQLT